MEDGPCWCLDLETIAPIREIRILNCKAHAQRAVGLTLAVSTDLSRACGCEGWRASDAAPCGARFVRFSLPGRKSPALDQIEAPV